MKGRPYLSLWLMCFLMATQAEEELSAKERHLIVKAHNRERRRTKPEAADMRQIVSMTSSLQSTFFDQIYNHGSPPSAITPISSFIFLLFSLFFFYWLPGIFVCLVHTLESSEQVFETFNLILIKGNFPALCHYFRTCRDKHTALLSIMAIILFLFPHVILQLT